VDGVDWDDVIEEVEDVGRLEARRPVETLLLQALVHLLKTAAWPNAQPCKRWRSGIVGFLLLAKRSFAPFMRQRISVEEP